MAHERRSHVFTHPFDIDDRCPARVVDSESRDIICHAMLDGIGENLGITKLQAHPRVPKNR